MFNAEAELDKEQCRREAAVVEAAREYVARQRAVKAVEAYERGRSSRAYLDAYFVYATASTALIAAVDSLEELIGPLQEPQP